jgi:nitroreductase
MGSVQSYDAAASEVRRPVKEQSGTTPDMRESVRLATLAASSHNTQPWKFRIGRETIEMAAAFDKEAAELL